ncbi:hypothetical protein [Aeromonas phage Asp37]|nr:hypothetical protein [Aeromonas phage Asp37]
MNNRDSNETGQSHRTEISPEAPRPERLVDPLTTEDYGTAQLLARLLSDCRFNLMTVTHTVKVDGDGRLVVEFQSVRNSRPLADLAPRNPNNPTT